jgi:hypothetical protein
MKGHEMRTIYDYPEGEFFARYATAIPYERKLEIFAELCRVARERGWSGSGVLIDYLDGAEFELLVTMLGERFPIWDHELEDAIFLYFLSGEKAR